MGVKVQSEWQTFQVIQFLPCILGICLKISINRGQMRYCCSISIKIWGNQYPEISSVRRSTPGDVWAGGGAGGDDEAGGGVGGHHGGVDLAG